MHPVPAIHRRIRFKRTRAPFAAAVVLLATSLYGQSKPAAETEKRGAADTVVLSPFEVVSDARGYYASNTMSGTRLNSKLEDLGASISVVTKEQMQDFALLDINDIFNYEAGTEGTGNYTEILFERDGNNVTDRVEKNPQGANRIRGLAAANITFGNFAGSGRVPIDPVNIDAVEINRGPNANIFGIGNASGSVNSVPSSANLLRNRSQFSARADDREGFRTTADLNRVLKPGVLAVRGSSVFQRDGYQLKPSGTDTIRLNGMVKFRPFKPTTLSLSHTYYKMHGNRANAITPIDAVTSWKAAGSPTWDPVTFTAKINGQPVGTFPNATTAATIPSYFTNFSNTNASLIFADQAGIGYWSVVRATSTTNPATGNQSQILMQSAPFQERLTQPLFSSYRGITDRSIYDWTSLNISAPNYYEDHAQITSALLDQVFFDTRRQTLALQLGWYRESNEQWMWNVVEQARYSSNFSGGGIGVDVNERLLDGTPNPYFLRPFVGAAYPIMRSFPRDQDIYRAQLAYKVDFRGEASRVRWLGAHQVAAYAEENHTIQREIDYLYAITSNHSWVPAGVGRALAGTAGGLQPSPQFMRPYYRFYVGDNQGQNVEYEPAGFRPGQYTLVWGNGVTGQFNREPVTLGNAVEAQSTGVSRNVDSILKSRGAILQSHLLKDRVIATFGVRRDQRFGHNGAPIEYLADGINLDMATYHAWQDGDWTKASGTTRQAGAVVRPVRWLSLHANRSDSFQPAAPTVDLNRNRLPDPTGEGDDYGFSLNLFAGKLVLRANQYKTKVLSSRTGQPGIIATRLLYADRPNVPGQASAPPAFQLQTKATEWAQAAATGQGRPLSAAQLKTEVARIMAVPEDFLDPFPMNIAATSDQIAKGREIEVNYNPTAFWTMKLNVTEQESIEANMAPEVSAWLNSRVAHWRTIIDPTTGRSWFTERYNNANSAEQFLAVNVTTPLQLALATDGKSKPQVRKYRTNFVTNFRLAGITEHRLLKRLNVGGALRWEDKGAIGYYGLETPPAIVTALDPNRPIYDKAHLYLDAFVGYRTRLFSDKVGATFQLNVRNATEDGRLQPIGAYPDGRPSLFRIIDRRQFILSATFDL